MAALRGQALAWPVSKLAGFSPRVRLPPNSREKDADGSDPWLNLDTAL